MTKTQRRKRHQKTKRRALRRAARRKILESKITSAVIDRLTGAVTDQAASRISRIITGVEVKSMTPETIDKLIRKIQRFKSGYLYNE